MMGACERIVNCHRRHEEPAEVDGGSKGPRQTAVEM